MMDGSPSRPQESLPGTQEAPDDPQPAPEGVLDPGRIQETFRGPEGGGYHQPTDWPCPRCGGVTLQAPGAPDAAYWCEHCELHFNPESLEWPAEWAKPGGAARPAVEPEREQMALGFEVPLRPPT